MKKSVGDFLSEMPYQYYYCDSAADRLEKKFKKSVGVNCSDTAPHEKEINALREAGFSDEQIFKIIQSFYRNFIDID